MVQFIQPRHSVLRASVVITALISLCVSSDVGPRFLPLPTLESAVAESSDEQQDITISRSHSNESDSFRVPMMAQSQKRADREPQAPLVLVPGLHVRSSNNGRVPATVTASDSLFISAILSEPLGRAPPDLV